MDATETTKRRLLLIGGSLRSGSTNAAVLKTAQMLTPDNAVLTIYEGLAELPHFNPDDDREPLPPAAARLRELLSDADGVLFSTPEYAGALPGSFKNLLDWTVGGGMYEKPIGFINASPMGGAKSAHAMLRVVLGFINADIVEAACVQMPVRRDAIGPDGVIADPAIQSGIRAAVAALVRHIESGPTSVSR
jgi:chromate reductase, NAD(P)H dehydrogenase (quinone)